MPGLRRSDRRRRMLGRKLTRLGLLMAFGRRRGRLIVTGFLIRLADVVDSGVEIS